MPRDPTVDELSLAAGSLLRLTFEARALLLAVEPTSLALLEANASARKRLQIGRLPAGPEWITQSIRLHEGSLRDVLSVEKGCYRTSATLLCNNRATPFRIDAIPEHLMNRRIVILEMTEIVEKEPPDVAAVNARFTALIQGISDAYYDWDVRTGFMDFSPRMEGLLGLRSGGLSRAEPGYWERIHPDDRTRVIGHNLKAISEAESYHEEYRMRHAEGHYILVTDWGVVIPDPDTGEAAHQIGTIRDITRERLAEQALADSRELYRTLFMSASNPAFRVDDRCVIADANPAAQALLEQPVSHILGTNLARYMPADFVDSVRRNLDTGQIDRRETQLRRPRAVHHLLFTIVPCEVSGAPSLFLLGTDVTPLVVEMRSTLRETERMLTRETEEFEKRNEALLAATRELQERKIDVEERVVGNIGQFVMPALERLQRSLADRPETAQVEAIKRSIASIARPLAKPIGSPVVRPGQPTFTRREAEIVTLIRAGKTTAEIAEALYLSPATVTFHRKSIRRKLGLGRGDVRLDTYFLGEALP